MTSAVKNLVLAMLGQAVECITRDDFERAEGWIAGAWDLVGELEFNDDDEDSTNRDGAA